MANFVEGEWDWMNQGYGSPAKMPQRQPWDERPEPQAGGFWGKIQQWMQDPRNQAQLQGFQDSMLEQSQWSRMPSPNIGMTLAQGTRGARQAGKQYDEDQWSNLERYLKLQNVGQTEMPSNVREWQYFNALPKDQKEEYLRMKRAQQTVDLGYGVGRLNQSGGGISDFYQRGLKPSETPEHAATVKQSQVTGQARGEAIANLPGILSSAQEAIIGVDELLKDPSLSKLSGGDRVLGNINAFFGGPVGGTKARLNQLKGTAFLKAYENLKGGGTITEIEGLKAEQAIARLETAQTDEQFVKALRDFRAAIERGARLAQDKAGSGYASPQDQPQSNSDGFSIRALD